MAFIFQQHSPMPPSRSSTHVQLTRSSSPSSNPHHVHAAPAAIWSPTRRSFRAILRRFLVMGMFLSVLVSVFVQLYDVSSSSFAQSSSLSLSSMSVLSQSQNLLLLNDGLAGRRDLDTIPLSNPPASGKRPGIFNSLFAFSSSSQSTLSSSVQASLPSSSSSLSSGSRAASAATTGLATESVNNVNKNIYRAAALEDYVMKRSVALNFHTKRPSACAMWKDSRILGRERHHRLQQYRVELQNYQYRLNNFTTPVRDIRLHLNDNNNHNNSFCDLLQLHPAGLIGIFAGSQLLSWSEQAGFVEPLLPPLRHPELCFKPFTGARRKSNVHKLNLQYLVHDFAHYCRQMKRTSRTVLIDMGASLQFHGEGAEQPAVYLVRLFQQFGMPFDHIYAYEITPTAPDDVFSNLPSDMQAAYHWINVGVDPRPDHPLNPLTMLLSNFHEDDFIVIKLDIDTSDVEMALAQQLLHDDRYSRLVDAFYFEHHVHVREMATNWGLSMRGTLQQSLQLFQGLRQKGIPAHSWV